jgi:hypothetical protein
LSILLLPFRSILNVPPSLPELSDTPENTLVQSDSTMCGSRGVWEHLDALETTGEVVRGVGEVCSFLPDRFTLCRYLVGMYIRGEILPI